MSELSPEQVAPQLGTVNVVFLSDGDIRWEDVAGEELPISVRDWIIASQWDRWEPILEARVRAMNSEIDKLSSVHLGTPAPGRSVFRSRDFTPALPSIPIAAPLTWLDRVLPWKKAEAAVANADLRAEYEEKCSEVARLRLAHEQSEDNRRGVFEAARRGDDDAIVRVIEDALSAISWPRATRACVGVATEDSAVVLDIDLPELEEMPREIAAPTKSGHRVRMRLTTLPERRALYVTHVFGVIFRVCGEAFAASETVERVVVSGYTQRRVRGTDYARDDYIISVQVTRDDWLLIDFEDLGNLDLARWFSGSGTLVDQTESGHFRTIKPMRSARSDA